MAIQAIRVQRFQNSLGVNTHMGYADDGSA